MTDHTTRVTPAFLLRRIRRSSLVVTSYLVFWSVLLTTHPNNVTASETNSIIVYESSGLWVMRQPWPETDAWCKNGGGSPAQKVYDVYAYYDVPHAERVTHLGGSYTGFIRDKVVPGIKALCGPQTAVTSVVLGLYQKQSETASSDVVSDLSNSRTPVLDIINFSVEGSEVNAVRWEPKHLSSQLSHEEVLSLDPRTKNTRQAALKINRFTDYTLYQGDGFTIVSAFDRPGTTWCEHVYVPLLIVHNESVEAVDEAIQPDYETFLQSKIVPKIKEICPTFPNANELFRQSIRLEFVNDWDARASSTMGYVLDDDGTVSWREGRQTQHQIELVAAREAAAAKRASEEAYKASQRILAIEKARDARTPTPLIEYSFFEVECQGAMTGFVHTNTLLPSVKISSSLGANETQAHADELADCFDSLATVIKVSNPFATRVRFEVIDNTGQVIAQNESPITPMTKTGPVDQPESLRLYTGVWKTIWYELDIRWEWGKREFVGVITSITPKGEEIGMRVGDHVLSASIENSVYVDEKTTGILAKLTLIQPPEPLVLEGALGIQLPPADFMIFSEGRGDGSTQIMFELVKRP